MAAKVYDLTHAPIKATDRLIIEDGEDKHIFVVNSVEGEPGDMRVLEVGRIVSSDAGMKRTTTLRMNPAHAVMGMVVSEAEYMADAVDLLEASGSINNLIVSELQKLLEGQAQHDFSASFGLCVKALQKLGLLEGDDKAAKRKLSRIRLANSEIFRSSGTYIHLVSPPKGGKITAPDSRSRTMGDTVIISRAHLNKVFEHLDLALYHALQSGILTGGRPVKLVDVE